MQVEHVSLKQEHVLFRTSFRSVPMSEGFWQAARRTAERLALVEPDGTRHSAGALLGEANRVVHGLRAQGVRAGDTIATVLPNGAAMVELSLAAAQAGFY